MDGSGTAATAGDDPRAVSANGGALAIEVHRSPAAIEAEWRQLARLAKTPVYQSPGWIAAWIATAAAAQGIVPAVVGLRQRGRLVAILPLGVERRGPIRIARFLGGEHANIRMPILDRTFALPGHDGTEALLRDIARAIGQVDLIDLDALPRIWNGRPLPFADHPAATSARLHVTSLRLAPQFSSILDTKRRSKKAKKHRAQVNALEPVGGYRLRRAQSKVDADAMLAAFLTEKAIWFRRMGIADSFAEPGIADFFRMLIAKRWRSGEALLELDALEFDGSIHAVLGSGIANGRLSACFLSVTDDEWRRITPGELLIHDVVAASCAAGIETLDLGRGEERYKASWLETKEEHVRLLLAVSARGSAALLWLRCLDRAERSLRENPRLWSLAKQIRALRGKNRETTDDERE